MPAGTGPELVFAVDIGSFTDKGFSATSTFDGRQVTLEFDYGDQGISLTKAMASRLRVSKGSLVSLIVEDDRVESSELKVADVGDELRVSDEKTYSAVGRGGGAVIRIRKAPS